MKICKFLSVLFISLYFFTLPSNFVMALPGPVLPYNLRWNITDIQYYLVGSAVNYATPIDAASKNWWRPFGPGSNNLHPNTRTYDQQQSAIDYYTYSDIYHNANAYTKFILNPNKLEVSPFLSDWSFGRVFMNIPYMNSAQGPGFTLLQSQQAIVAHEQGHVFGLNENNLTPYSIMTQSAYGRSVYTVQQTDNDAFNMKHP